MRHEMVRRLEFDYGHRLLLHESKCAHVHGHRALVEVACTAELDPVGRVIDFGVVKQLVGGWLDEHLDHAFIAQEGDPLIAWLVEHGQRHKVLKVAPTAENLARQIFLVAVQLLADRGVRVEWVRFWETPNGSAIWRREQTFDIRECYAPHTSGEARDLEGC